MAPPVGQTVGMSDTSQSSAPVSLLRHDAVVMQQISAVFANEFDILDTSGDVVGHLVGRDGIGSRFFMGPREFTLQEADGRELLHIVDPPDFGFDRFELTTPDGANLALLQRQFAFFRESVRITTADNSELELRGDFFGFDFEVLDFSNPVARISREWAGLGRGLLGHSRYVVGFGADVPPQLRLTVLGSVVALDLIRMKQEKSNS